MSAGEDSVVCTPICQGILKKRKDKIRLRWVTYWFKLHNTSLFFYNIKHGNISDLRGQYNLIEIEDVRELMWTKKKHYIFEIALKNGKRKVLAADTADIRQYWMCQLLQAMNHHVYNTTEQTSDREMAPEYMSKTQSSSSSDISNMQSEVNDVLVGNRQPVEPNSYLSSPSTHSAAAILTTTSHIYIDIEMSPIESSQCSEEDIEQMAEGTELENDYDVLPLFKSLNTDEAIYDTPPSNQQASEREHETTESIYDTPKFGFRNKSLNETSCSKDLPEITGLIHDIVTCLGGNSADWARITTPGAICQP